VGCCTPWPREANPELHDLYARKLLEPGWAGLLTFGEAAYIQSRLEADARLKRKWVIRYKRPPLSQIAEKAYPEDTTAARRHMRAEQTRGRRKTHSKGKMSPAADMIDATTKTSRGENPLDAGSLH
jgi:hypothetical protein